MKVLFFSDIHGDKKALKRIVDESKKAELVVCAGDLSVAGEGLQDMINILGEISRKKILIIPGNNETPQMIEESIDDFENIILIHGDIYQDKNIKFLGLGGGTISPFNTVYEVSEDVLKNKLKQFKNIDCLVVHSPPKDTELDKINSGLHIGSSEILKWILENKPRICCCAHVHENAGKHEMIGKTFCFNPGPKGAIFEV